MKVTGYISIVISVLFLIIDIYSMPRHEPMITPFIFFFVIGIFLISTARRREKERLSKENWARENK